jgi:hypothetical protein
MLLQNKKNHKSPYLLGLLCLLPLIGALVGIGLILYGIFKYKDKWLVAIGIGGLIITIGFYSFLFYNLKYGVNTAKGFATISQNELNSLVKNIEFYKIENGVYPDSLEQLRKPDEVININDPLLIRKMDNNIKTTFQYEKIGNKYTLFSVGIDGVPNTADDIYPTILDADSSKFGLIKNH